MRRAASRARKLPKRLPMKQELSLEDIQACQISRNQMEQAEHEPWFESFIKGAWARCRAKGKRPDGEPLYKLYHIRGLHTSLKSPTNVEQAQAEVIKIKLSYGKKTVGLSIDKVSNHPIQQKELDEYVTECKKSKARIPSRLTLQKQRAQMLKYLERLPEDQIVVCELEEQDPPSICEIPVISPQSISSEFGSSLTDLHVSPPPMSPDSTSDEPTSEIRACHLGLSGLGVLFLDFHISPLEFTAIQKSKSADRLSPLSSRVYLLCLSGDQREFIKGTGFEDARCCWPKRGPLLLDINNTHSWIPYTLPVCGSCDPLDITPYIRPGENTLKLVHLASLEDYTFATCVYELGGKSNLV